MNHNSILKLHAFVFNPNQTNKKCLHEWKESNSGGPKHCPRNSLLPSGFFAWPGIMEKEKRQHSCSRAGGGKTCYADVAATLQALPDADRRLHAHITNKATQSTILS
jgi:hypothetical protein